jgi:hypothetical protein
MSKQKLLYHRADGFYDHAMWFRFFNAAGALNSSRILQSLFVFCQLEKK